MEGVYGVISAAQPGSDIHGVLEKIAYNLHLREPRGSAGVNWNSAKGALRDWVEKRKALMEVGKEDIKQDLKEVLRFSAYFYRDNGETSFDHWIEAQNKLANRISEDYCRKLEECKRQMYECQERERAVLI